jgi:hypothetical protein
MVLYGNKPYRLSVRLSTLLYRFLDQRTNAVQTRLAPSYA